MIGLNFSKFNYYLTILIFSNVLILSISCKSTKTELPISRVQIELKPEIQEENIKLISKKIKIFDEDCFVDIYFFKEDESLAKLILEKSSIYLIKVSDYLQVKPLKKRFVIKQNKIVSNISENKGYYILYSFLENDFKLYYLINKWWFSQEPFWLSEGINSFLPLAMNESGFLNLTEKDIREFYVFNNFFIQSKDLNIYPIFDNSEKREKYFKAQFIIFFILGKNFYRDFLINLIGSPTNVTENWVLKDREINANTKSILNYLRNYVDLDWSSYLTGWAFSGKYINILPADFVESKNSLIDISRNYNSINMYKKSPESNLEEFKNSKQLFEENEKKDNLPKVEDNSIVMDGFLDEWRFVPSVKVKNNTLEIQEFLKVKRIFVHKRNSNLYLGFFLSKKSNYELNNLEFGFSFITEKIKQGECDFYYEMHKNEIKSNCISNIIDFEKLVLDRHLEVKFTIKTKDSIRVFPKLKISDKEIPIWKYFIKID
jgi:hypothetical protein